MSEVLEGTPVVVGNVVITPLERVTRYCSTLRGRCTFCYACKEPVGIKIESPDREWAIGVDGQETPVEALLGKQP